MKQSVPNGSEQQQARQFQSAADMAHAGNSPSFVDNRPETIALRQLKDAIRSSPKIIAQRNRMEQFHNNPRMIAQRTESGYTKSPAPQMHDGTEYELLQGKLGAVQRIEEEEPLQGKLATVQRIEEEEPVQGKFDAVQRIEDEEPLQGKFAIESPAQLEQQSTAKTNDTGLPDNLKSGIESLSGLSMDSVRVHYNSSQPAQLNALAYAQGTDIHVAPGQEKHLPHEAWHVVQQAQGRVKPTMQMKDGVLVNDDTGLEHEADVMGARALADGKTSGDGAQGREMVLNFPASGSPNSGIMDSQTSTLNPVQQEVNDSPRQHSQRLMVQRKIGFEIEMPNVEVKRGRLTRPAHRASSDDEEEGFITFSGSKTPLLSTSKRIYHEEEEVVESTGQIPIKGEGMVPGAGWKLTPDGSPPDNWYGEFITSPIDETQNPGQIAIVLDEVAHYATNIGIMANMAYRSLPNNYLLRRLPGPIRGGFQITGGIKLDQLFQLLQRLSDAANVSNDNVDAELDPQDTAIFAHATHAGRGAQQRGLSESYKGLVALTGSYIAGQHRFYALAEDEELDLQLNPPDSGKHLLPVMSRTNLGTIRAKVPDMPALMDFLADVLDAAHLGSDQADAPLFPIGLAGGVNPARSIDANPGITIRQWITGLYGGPDFRWSETRNSTGGEFGVEGVGPDIPQTILGCLPWFSTRAEGAIVELRNLTGEVPVGKWTDLGRLFAEIFRNLNAQ